MEEAHLVALYTRFETALRVMDELGAEGFGAEAVNVLSPHAAGRHGTATAADVSPDRPGRHDVNDSDIGPLVVIGPLAEQIRGRELIQVLRDRGITVEVAQRAAEALRRGGSIVVVDTAAADHDRALAVIDRHQPGGLETLGTTYFEPGWSRADEVAGAEGVLEIADDRLNVKKPGEDASEFRSLAPGPEELRVEKSGGRSSEAGSGELHGSQPAGPDR
ncbi:hypothetical protein [Skermanella pratensis]|uniref:hypothetical protein n=1 Tax=Skermanella pratensis TaxID=2233999 RepID=UPI001300EDC4|nr:hypothetical protein [Skermanella pratensis]